MNPKVSVILPSYNHEKFLRKRIESILDQTFEDFEVIIIDDASSDNSRSIINEYLKDGRITTFFNKQNSGDPSVIWNRGVKKARGEYIWIAESDDYADNKLLETLVGKLNENPNVGIAYTQSFYVDENDNITGSGDSYTDDLDKERWKRDFYNIGKDECREFLLFKNTIPNASAVVFRKNLYIKAGYADENIGFGADWLIWFSILLYSDIYYCKDCLNYFRYHTGTQRIKQDGTEFIEQCYKILAVFKSKLTFSEENLNKFLNFQLKSWIYIIFYSKERTTFKKKMNVINTARKVDPEFIKRFLQLAVKSVTQKTFKH